MTTTVQPLNQAQAAALLGVTARRLRQMEQETTVPRSLGNGGRAAEYPVEQFGEWLRQRWLKSAGVTSSGEVYDEKVERARLLHHQANNEALKESVNRMNLLRAEVVERVWSDMVLSFRSKLLGLPSRAAQVVMSMESQNAIEEYLSSIVSESLFEIADFSADQYSDKIVQPTDIDSVDKTNGKRAKQ